MYLIHPRRYYRNFKNKIEVLKLKRQAKKYGVELLLGSNVRIENCSISSNSEHGYPNSKLGIEDNCYLKCAHFGFFGENSTISIGAYTHTNGGEKNKVTFQVGADSAINIGEECLFAGGVVLCTTDFHPVFNEQGERTNPNKDIFINNHVWFARHAYINKGVTIGKNSIVGAHSVVSKSFMKENVVIVGNPATIKKENIYWEE